MRKGQSGQAFILVLMFLAIGSLLIVPALRLTNTELQTSRLIERKTRALYAAGAAQEWVLWALTDPDYVADMTMGVPEETQLDVCGITVDISIVMLATEGTGGITLATEHTVKPTKTVEHQYLPGPVPDRRFEYYTYTINLEQLSSDTTQGLDAIYDLPPNGFGASAYQTGTSQLRVDGGPWLDIPDPEWNASKGYLKWPAEYDKDTHTGNFSSNPDFLGIEVFEVRQVKELRFQMYGRLANDDTHCNWVVLILSVVPRHPSLWEMVRASVQVTNLLRW